MKRLLAFLTTGLLIVNSIPYPQLMMKTAVLKVPDRTGTEPVSYETIAKMQQELAAWPVLTPAGLQAHEQEKNAGTYVIPGMKSTLSMDRDGRPDTCVDMTPQGLAVTDDYIFISAYCHEKEHNSVLYMISRDSHEFVKTIVLEGQPHAGSVCWDPVWKHLWVSTGYTNNASASYLRIRDIEKYSFSQTGKPLPWYRTQKLTQLTRNSFMTCYDSRLYAGTFTLDEPTMRLQSFDLIPPGRMARSGTIAGSAIIGQQCQGITFTDDYVFLTFSYGPYIPSTLCAYPRTATRFLKSDAIRSWQLPPCLEQPYALDNTLYLMWESPARCFRNELMTHIDRVLALDISRMMH
ncbi:hypothetical protein [uncultured Faecalibaculum sp.]|uniref:hypothetical protein n=1 Tax=uncultured Faecalibaculum sp. TaxID=1729681 RepID=UPI00260BBD24|nr:hypothetical protein [uncultured Faecalibaculum sp.]